MGDAQLGLLRRLARTLPTSGQPVAPFSGRLSNDTFINSRLVRSVALNRNVTRRRAESRLRTRIRSSFTIRMAISERC